MNRMIQMTTHLTKWKFGQKLRGFVGLAELEVLHDLQLGAAELCSNNCFVAAEVLRVCVQFLLVKRERVEPS